MKKAFFVSTVLLFFFVNIFVIAEGDDDGSFDVLVEMDACPSKMNWGMSIFL